MSVDVHNLMRLKQHRIRLHGDTGQVQRLLGTRAEPIAYVVLCGALVLARGCGEGTEQEDDGDESDDHDAVDTTGSK